MPNCRKCSAPIFFAKTVKKDGSQSAKAMPFDYVAHPEGTHRVEGKGTNNAFAYYDPASKITPGTMTNRERYISHFALCPYADDFRRPQRAADRNLKQGVTRA